MAKKTLPAMSPAIRSYWAGSATAAYLAHKLYILAYRGEYTVMERVPGGVRAVSKTFNTLAEAEAALRAKGGK